MSKKEKVIRELKIVYPDLDEMPDDVYSNNVRINHSENDFIIYFAKVDVPPILPTEEYSKKEVKARVVSRVRITPSLAESFLKALESNIKSFKEKKKGK